ncbi:hypothetical protein JCM8202v2_002681 [Rhodotorula sphaerocarpa]
MGDLLAAAEAGLLERLRHLGPAENPYLVAKDFFRDQLFPDVPDSAVYQLYALAGLFALCGINVLVSLLWRAKKGVFWLFTMQQTPRLIRPHVVVAWSSIAFLMILFLEVFIALTIRFLRKIFYGGFGYFFFTVWFFAFWGGQTATWSLAASYIVHRRATSTDTLTWQVRLTNLLGPLVPVVYAAILLAFAIPGGTHYAHAIEVAREVDAQLLERASNWQPGQPFSILNLAWAMPLLQREAAYFADFLDSFRRVYALFAVTAALLVISLVSIAGVYFAAIRAGLDTGASAARRKIGNGHGPSSTEAIPSAKLRRNLRLTIILFTSLGILFVVDAALAASSPLAFVQSPIRAQILILLPLYTFATLGLPCSILLLHASYTVSPTESSVAEASGGSGSGRRSKHAAKSGSTSCSRRVQPSTTELEQLSIQLETLGSFSGKAGEFVPKKLRKTSRSGGVGVGGEGHHGATQASVVSVQVDVDVMVEEDLDDEDDEKHPPWIHRVV